MTILAVVYAGVLLVANGVLTVAFVNGPCGAEDGTPGSDRDAYCGFLSNHPAIDLVLVVAVPLLVLGFGLHAARRRDSRGLVGTLLAGVALTLVVHVPPWFLSA